MYCIVLPHHLDNEQKTFLLVIHQSLLDSEQKFSTQNSTEFVNTFRICKDYLYLSIHPSVYQSHILLTIHEMDFYSGLSAAMLPRTKH